MRTLEGLVHAVWGWPAAAIFLAAGLWLTRCSGAVQLRRLGGCLAGTLGGLRRGGSGGSMSPLAALSTALGGTVGTGNIAGVAAAVAAGGPGVLFWMWVSAFIGMALKYSEVLLAVKYRERGADGERHGGPMYYIKNGLGRRFMPLARLFALAGSLAALGMGSAVQSGEIARALRDAFSSLGPGVGDGFALCCGIVIALLAFAVLGGGLARLGSVTALLVPGMSLLYLAACAAVIAANADRLLPCLGDIISGAFRPEAGLGVCVGLGLRRGIFSNEAGLGSAPIAHAASSETDCVRQGMAGVFEVFADTIVICSATGLAMLTSGCAGTGSAAAAFSTVLGEGGAAAALALSVTLFAFSSLLSWGMYGRRCCGFLLGERSTAAYTLIFCAAALAGPLLEREALWLAADVLNALMAAPNMAALLLLSPVVSRESRRYFDAGRRVQT